MSWLEDSTPAVAVGCVADNDPKFLDQALRLIQSWRWFGGALASADFHVCVIDGVDTRYRQMYERYGATVHVVPRFSSNHPPSNKLRFLELMKNEDVDRVVLLDCDTLIVQEPLRLLAETDFAAKIADMPTVPPDIFRTLFSEFDLALPSADQYCTVRGESIIPYFNAGVLSFSKQAMKSFVPEWIRINSLLVERMHLLNECSNFCEQASLSLALKACGTFFTVLGNEMNFPAHFMDEPADSQFAQIDPVIIHYHWLTDASGFLVPSPYPHVNVRICQFNERLKVERHLPFESAVKPPQRVSANNKGEMRKCIMIFGMHRSGTSSYAGVLNKLGISFGQNLMEAKEDNERGFFENQHIYAVNESILRAIDSSWEDVFPLSAYWWKKRALSVYRDRISEIIDKEFESEELFGIKDPRMCILFPCWQEILRDMQIVPSFVIPVRHPLEVAQSLEKRNQFPIRKGIFLWMKHMMDAEYHSRGFKRVFVSFNKLLFNPEETICHIANTLDLNFPGKWEDEKRAISDFLDAEIKHHCADDSANHHVPQYIDDYYRSLLNLVSQCAVGDVDPFHMDAFRKRHLNELRAGYRHDNGVHMQVSTQTIDIGGVNIREMGKINQDTPMEVKQVSIVVVNYNGRKYLEPLFNSLFSMDRDNARLEIIMVDNLSNDDSVSLVKEMFPEIIIVENDVNNFTRALNLGIEQAGGNYIAFLNNDIIVDSKWLKGLLTVMDGDERIGAVQSKILFSDGEKINSVGVEEVKDFYFKDVGFDERDDGQYQNVKEIKYFTGGSVLLKRACIESVGKIDEDLIMFFEDIDYSIRCRRAGWKLFYSPESVVYHKYHGIASSELAVFFCSRNRLLCLAKHFPMKLPESAKTSNFYVNHEHENLYQTLIQAARKLIAGHSAATSLKVLGEIKDIMIEIYGVEKTSEFFAQVEVLTGLKQIKMGIYDHLLKFSDDEMMKAGELIRKPSFYLSQITGPMYMSAMLDRPILAVFNQVNEVTSLLQTSEQDRAARLEQVNELMAKLKESEADRTARLGQVNELTENLKVSELDRAARLEQVNELTENLKVSESDRAARLKQQNELTENLKMSESDRAARFDQIMALTKLVKESESDRAARLEVIHRLEGEINRLEEKINRLEQGLRELESTFVVRLARRIGLIKTRKVASRELNNEN